MNRRIHALLATFAVVAAGVPANANLKPRSSKPRTKPS
jgi:hypothetical protein